MDTLHTAPPPKEGPPGQGPSAPRPRAPVQVVWAHDALRDSVVSGRTYQYHMRLRLFNRCCGFPGDLKDPAEAEKVLVFSDWSDPSPDVPVKPDSAFFLTSAANNEVRAEVFKWEEGEWAKQTFKLEVGKPVGEPKRVMLKSDSKWRMVNFDTGSVVVAIDPNATYRPVKVNADGALTLSPTAKSSVAVVYVDSTGQLYDRVVDADKDSTARKEFQDLAKQKPPVHGNTDTSTPGIPLPDAGPPAGPPGTNRPPWYGPPGQGPPGGQSRDRR